MESKIKVIRDSFHKIVECEFTDEQVYEISKLTADKLYNYIHDNSVDKMNTIPGNDKYYLPRLNIGKLSLSLQPNYYFWANRDRNDCDHAKLITESEFKEIIPNSTIWIDVMIMYDHRQLMSGQFSCEDVANLLKDLLQSEMTLYTL